MSFYGVELLYESRPVLDPDSLLASVKKRCPGAVMPMATESLATFFHEDHPAQFSDGAVPVQTVVIHNEQQVNPEILQASLQQSWAWSDAKAHRAAVFLLGPR